MGAHGSRADGADGQSQSEGTQTSQVYHMLRGQGGYGSQRFGAAGSGPGLFTNRPDQSMLFFHGPKQITSSTPQLQLTETIRNDVNLKKPSLKLNMVPDNPNTYCLEFIFDAAADCSMSIWYLAEESIDPATNTANFESTYQVIFLHHILSSIANSRVPQIKPKTRQFKKGLGQRFVLDPEEGFNTALVQNRGLMYYHQVLIPTLPPR
jgi:hypothetical protein